MKAKHNEALCELCLEQRATVMFQPCQHKLVCRDCSIKMKKCIECKTPISAKYDEGKCKAFHAIKDFGLSFRPLKINVC